MPEEKLMSLKFVSSGDPTRMPEIGARVYLQDHLFFKVEAYGESHDVPGEEYGYPGRTLYEVELLGCLVVPAGSPIEVLSEKVCGLLSPDLLKGETK